MEFSRVELPITPSPITVYQYLAYPLAVLLNYQECLPWFYSNYIQLEFFKEEKRLTLDFIGGWVTDIPWVCHQYFAKDYFLNNFPNTHDSIKKFLNDGWYFYSVFDEFYVPNRRMYRKMHSPYDFLLTGYNDGEQGYSILGYGHRWIFESAPVKYTDFLQAFEPDGEQQFVILFRKRENFCYEFDLKYVSAMLADYLYSRDTSARLKLSHRSTMENKIFGLNTYHSLIEYFQWMMDQQVKQDIRFSHRLLHALWEHKKCMLLRLEYLNQRRLLKKTDYFLNSYLKLENDALVMRNDLLKFSLSKDWRLLEKISNSLQEMRQLEPKIIEELLELIDH